MDQLYLAGRVGYDLCMPEQLASGLSSVGGLYFGVGVGFNVSENIVLEANYCFHNGGITDGFITMDLDYSKLSIGAGFKF